MLDISSHGQRPNPPEYDPIAKGPSFYLSRGDDRVLFFKDLVIRVVKLLIKFKVYFWKLCSKLIYFSKKVEGKNC